ncbi:uncharacterized protein N7483_009230 [Penicillium malachiteum]|uniref:uncharacterized protein n=1 Tax=Penicillium malachiteum TaxID=1324776 RepID=UPI0025493DE1|nr:uncharacterized protein N7483_009230 [Penicillium malachiteum]KAJ5721296.1 hypothetical protein N7483_009230 [Penicillium malachiteum]
MADQAKDATPIADKLSSFAHDEHVDDDAPKFEALDISYDNNGIKGILNSPFVFGAALLASFGGFSFGYDQGVISLILVMPQFTDQFPEVASSSPHSGFNKGLLTGILELGAFIGCIAFPCLADRISRKWAISIATGFFCVGAIMQTASQTYDTLVAEIAPPNLRGSLMVLESVSIVIGAIVAYWITYGTRAINGDWAFRLPFLLQMIPALTVGCGIHFFPFSPRWLALRDRNEESLESLARLRRLPATDETVQVEWKGIIAEDRFQKEILIQEHPDTGPIMMEVKQWLDLFRSKYLKRTIVATAIPFFQQFSGINAFVYYAPTFFSSLGQTYNKSLILSGMINICQLIGNIPILLYFDQIGRRRIAIFGAFLMAIPHLIMAGIYRKFSSSWQTHQGVGWFGVALIYVYVLAYALSYGPLGWVLPAEVFPSSKRAKGVGLAVAVNWLANFIIGVVVPQMLESIGWGTFLFFGLFCVAAGIFSFLFVPETANRSLEQIAAIFGDDLNAEEDGLRLRIQMEVWAETNTQHQV